MHELIARYIEETIRHLKPSEREEVAKELGTNITDMVGENPSEAVIEQILLEMGSPAELASKYRGKERYLIGPATFDIYFKILKLVALVVGVVTLVFALISLFLSSNAPAFGTILSRILGTVLSALSASFVWVTITFALLDYYQVKMDDEGWDVKALHALEALPTKTIKRGESIVDIVGLSVFMLLLVFFYSMPQLVAIYLKGFDPVPIFLGEQIRPYLIGWMITTLFTLTISVIKLHQGRWSNLLLGFSIGCDLLGLIYFIFLVTRWQLYNPEFFSFFNNGVNTWKTIIKAGSVALTILTLISITDDVYTVLKKTVQTESEKAPVQ